MSNRTISAALATAFAASLALASAAQAAGRDAEALFLAHAFLCPAGFA